LQVNGDNDSPTSYALHTDTLPAGKALRFAPPRGRPTRDAFPYYDLGLGDQGVIAVIGWPGKWATEFMQSTRDSVRIMAGQQTTSLKLKPGEEIRSPLVVLQFYKGDWIRSQNIWPSMMIS
jgi:alpha-galactosidase